LREQVWTGAGIATLLASARLIAYAINDRDRWRRFLVLVLLVLAAASARWLFADGGVLVLLHDFGLASITRPHSRFG